MARTLISMVSLVILAKTSRSTKLSFNGVSKVSAWECPRRLSVVSFPGVSITMAWYCG